MKDFDIHKLNEASRERHSRIPDYKKTQNKICKSPHEREIKRQQRIEARHELIRLRRKLKDNKATKDWWGSDRIWGNHNHTAMFYCCICKSFLPPCRFLNRQLDRSRRRGEIMISPRISIWIPGKGHVWAPGHVCDECEMENLFAEKFYSERAKAREHLRKDLPRSVIDANEYLIDEKIFQMRFRNQFKTIKIKL